MPEEWRQLAILWSLGANPTGKLRAFKARCQEGRYRVIHMTRAANKALGHNRINLSEGLKQLLQKSLENIKVVEETTRTLKLEN